MEKSLTYIIALIVVVSGISCTEPFEIESKNFENVLVVEGTITDEIRPQIIKLSRTSTLDTVNVIYEDNAQINVVGSDGANYHFTQERETGHYISDEEFNAQPNIYYSLKIITKDGRHFTSSEVILPPAVPMDQVFADRVTEPAKNRDGVEVLINTQDLTGNAKYFRYEYDETYKVVVPYPSRFTVEIVNEVSNPRSYDLIITPREPEEVCYSTEYSSGIIQTTTTELNQNKVFRFPVKYLPKEDFKLRDRYSILVRQYVQSEEAYTFYKTIKDMGSLGSILSQGQPGYVVGNIINEDNPEEKVIGFFEISSVSSQRIFFDYHDFDLPKPPYFTECEVYLLNYNQTMDPDDRSALYNYIKYFDYQVLGNSSTGIYRIVNPECSICTYFSSNIKPDFWEN